MKRWRWMALPAALMLFLTLAGPALAGAPGEGKEPEQPMGGLPPVKGGGPEGGSTVPAGRAGPPASQQAEPGSGWTEYAPRPAATAGPVYPAGSTQALTWPRPIEDIWGWIAENLNPAKWVADAIDGALTGILRTLAGLLAQPAYWLFGWSVPDRYSEGGGAAAGFNVVTVTYPQLTFASPIVWEMVHVMRSAALAFLGVAVAWVALRELLRMLRGESQGVALLETFGRLVVATGLAAGGGWWLAATLIELNNHMILAIIPNDLVQNALNAITYNNIADPLLQSGLILETALTLVVLVFTLLVLGLIMLGRIVLLDALLILAPLAGMAYASEETEFFFRRWVQVLLSATFYQFLSMVFLWLAARFLTASWYGFAAGNPILLALLGTAAVIMTIVGPPMLGFAMGKIAGAGQRAARQIVSVVGG